MVSCTCEGLFSLVATGEWDNLPLNSNWSMTAIIIIMFHSIDFCIDSISSIYPVHNCVMFLCKFVYSLTPLRIQCYPFSHRCCCISGGTEWGWQDQNHLEQITILDRVHNHWLLSAVQKKGHLLLQHSLHHSLSVWLWNNLIHVHHHQPQSWYNVWSESCIRGPFRTEWILLWKWEAGYHLQQWV